MTIKCNCNYFLTFKKLEAAPLLAYAQCTYIPDDPENFESIRQYLDEVGQRQLGRGQAMGCAPEIGRVEQQRPLRSRWSQL